MKGLLLFVTVIMVSCFPVFVQTAMIAIAEGTAYFGILFGLSLVAYFLIRIITHRH